MNLRRRNKVTSHVSTESLSDIMFFLLLFFLLTSMMVNPNVIKLLLPTASSAQTFSKRTINISVNAKDEYYIDKKRVTIESLEPELAQTVKGIVEPTVVLRMDKALSVEKLVGVLSIVNKLKLKVLLATKAGV